MIVKINKLAYLAQVALVFAAWFLVPVQQASQISSVWLTDYPSQAKSSNQKATSSNDDQHQIPIVLKTNHQQKPASSKRPPADFSSTSAGQNTKGLHFDSQASSFLPTIAELDTSNNLQVLARRSDNDDDDDDAIIQRSKPQRRRLFVDQPSFNSTQANFTAKQNNYYDPLMTYGSLRNEPAGANRNQQVLASPSNPSSAVENALGLYGNVGNESMNQHIHFDEEQHQQLTNWAHKANKHNLNQLDNSDQVNYKNQTQPRFKNNKQQRFINDTNQQQNSRPPANNGGGDLDVDLETTTIRPFARNHNKSTSSSQQHYYSFNQDDDQQPANEHNYNQGLRGATYEFASNPRDRTLLRFSPADQLSGSSWPADTGQSAYPTTTLAPPTSVVTTTDRPPVVYFNADGDKWNQNWRDEQTIDRKQSFSNDNMVQTHPMTIQLRNRDAAASDYGLTKFKYQPVVQNVDTGRLSDRYEYLYQPNSELINEVGTLNRRRAISLRDLNEPITRQDIGVLRTRQAQLQRLRKQALLMQLKRNKQLAQLYQNNRYPLASSRVLRLPAGQSYLDAYHQFGHDANANNPRRWFLGTLGQKLALQPSLSQPTSNQDYSNLVDPDEARLSHLERYFYSKDAPNHLDAKPTRAFSLARIRQPQQTTNPLINRHQQANMLHYPGYPYAPAYIQGQSNGAHGTILRNIRQPTIPRAPGSMYHTHNADRYLASGSYDQASYLDANTGDRPPLSAVLQNNDKPAGPAFIPVVAVTVTKTSPAPKVTPLTNEEPSDTSRDSDAPSPDLDEYIEKKTRLNNQYAQQKPRNERSQSRLHNNNGQSDRHMASSNDYYLPAPSSNRNHQQQPITTVKSAVFGYLPNQLQELNPALLGNVLNAAQQQQASNNQQHLLQPQQITDQFYQPQAAAAEAPLANAGVQDPGLPLALQLQANNLIQNDIVHPFGSPAGGAPVDPSVAAYPTTRNQQHVPMLGHASSSPYIQFASPMLPTDPNTSPTGHGAAIPFGHGSHQAAGQQLIAFAASELKPLAQAAIMMPGGRGPALGPGLLAANPMQWYYDTTGGAAESSNSVNKQDIGDSQPAASIVNHNNNHATSKGKKRSSEFFASAGQILLSALPLLLAPLMLASIPPVLPTVARHTNVPSFPQQASGASSAGLQTGAYMNSLASGVVSSSLQQQAGSGSGGPHLFTPTPPLLSAPANPYQSHNVEGKVKPTRYPNQNRGTTSSSVNNRYLNASSIMDSLLSGPNKPAAIVITTSTTSSPLYNNNNNSSSIDRNQYDGSESNGTMTTTTTTRQTIAAVDNLSVLSNQTVVFIPSSDPNQAHVNFSQGTSQYYNTNPEPEMINSGSEPEIMTASASVSNKPHLNNNPDKISSSQGFTNQDQQPSTANELAMKRHHHYELIPTGGSAASAAGYIDGADFDTQYASLPKQNDVNARQDTTNASSSADTAKITSSTNINENISSSTNSEVNLSVAGNDKDNPTTSKLYPLSSWPSLRRKTISLVTSQGNKTYSDSSDRYRDPGTTGGASSEFIVKDSNLVTKRPNSRIFRRRLTKRDTLDQLPITNEQTAINLTNSSPSDSEKLVQQEARRTARVSATLISSDLDEQARLASGDPSLLLSDFEEARKLRNEMLDSKVQLGKIARNGANSGELSVANRDEPKRQELSKGSRGQIVIQLPVSTQNVPRVLSQDSMDTEMSAHGQLMSEIVGDIMVKNQNEIMAQNALDAEVAEDTDPGGLRLDAEIVRSGHLEEPHSERNQRKNRRRSTEFSRQVKYSNQMDAPFNQDQYSNPQQVDILNFENRHRDRSSSSDSYQQNWATNRDQLDFNLRPTISAGANHSRLSHATTGHKPNNNQMLRPVADYNIGNQRNRRQQQQVLDNGASTLSPYSTNEFRPSTNVPTVGGGYPAQHQQGDDYYSYQNQNAPQKPYYNNNNNGSFRSGYPSRNYYPQPGGVSAQSHRDMYSPIPYNNNTLPPVNNNYIPTNSYNQQPAGFPSAYQANTRHSAAGSSQNEDYVPYQHQQYADQRAYNHQQQQPLPYQNPPNRARYDQLPAPMHRDYPPNHLNPNIYPQNHQQPSNDYYRVPVPPLAPEQPYDAMQPQPPPSSRSIGPYGLMDERSSPNGYQQQQQQGHYAAGSMLAHQAGPLASLAANNSNDSGTVNEYLKQVHFSDSDRDKLMASYLTCDGLLNDNDHCLERLSCEFSDPQNIEKANKLDRAVSSILLGHILINTYIPNNFKHRLKAASLFGYKHSGKCNRFVCNKLIQQHQSTSSGSTSSDSNSQSSSLD